MQHSRQPNLPISPPLTQLRLSGDQPDGKIRVSSSNWQIPRSQRSVGKQRQQACEQATRQQVLSATSASGPSGTAQPRQQQILAAGPVASFNSPFLASQLPTNPVSSSRVNVRLIVAPTVRPQFIQEQGVIRPGAPPSKNRTMEALPTPPATQVQPCNNQGKFYPFYILF